MTSPKPPSAAARLLGRLCVTSTQRKVPVSRSAVRRLANFILRAERARLDVLDVAIVGRRRMARLNEAYLGHAGPTDVLSFDLGVGPTGGICAQLVVCSDVAERQARRRGHPPKAELLLYVAHGLLHVLGYDDQTERGARRMHAREDELLQAFGLGPVYGAGSR